MSGPTQIFLFCTTWQGAYLADKIPDNSADDEQQNIKIQR